jgi:hypothetical protein
MELGGFTANATQPEEHPFTPATQGSAWPLKIMLSDI